MIKYMSPKRGMHGVKGTVAINQVKGDTFWYGYHSGGDVFPVHKDDVFRFNRHTGQMETFDSRFQPIVRLPEAKKAETPPPAPMRFDPQVLPGVNPKMAAGMLAAGLDSKEKVLEAGQEGLVAISGIGPVTARKVIEYLSR